MSEVRHVIGISGGKDSAALAIYLNKLYPEMNFIYYSADTGRELAETYTLIEQLEIELGVKIDTLEPIDFKNQNLESVFDFYLQQYDNYLPSTNARWCTKRMKLDPFEKWIKNTPTISYVGIRGDEDREGYISTKPHIQSIFPFRKNIWSVDVINRFIKADIAFIKDLYKKYLSNEKLEKVYALLDRQLNFAFTKDKKVDTLLDIDIKAFNRVIFDLV
jgi:3'-phosphoadenosine 5'-phosphosulfate sulfotransferase (PAPS reductase)/FAD synthetase